jgi:hypothetical protein
MMSQEPVNITQVNPQPKRFILNDSASNTEIIFLPQAPNFTAPQLDYQGLEGKFSFRGDDIRQQRTALGLLITVTLEPDADAGQLNLNLMLPSINFAGEKAQEFETIAIKTRSQGHVIDPAGAELFYRALMLKGVAQAVIPLETAIAQAQESILEVTDVRLSVLKSFPPQLQIAASGTVSTSGWSNPQLVPFNYVQAPPDGIYDFEFVATPPQDVTAQVITAIAANYIWKTFPQELVGVRIHSSTNSKAVRLNAPVSTSETCD